MSDVHFCIIKMYLKTGESISKKKKKKKERKTIFFYEHLINGTEKEYFFSIKISVNIFIIIFSSLLLANDFVGWFAEMNCYYRECKILFMKVILISFEIFFKWTICMFKFKNVIKQVRFEISPNLLFVLKYNYFG